MAALLTGDRVVTPASGERVGAGGRGGEGRATVVALVGAGELLPVIGPAGAAETETAKETRVVVVHVRDRSRDRRSHDRRRSSLRKWDSSEVFGVVARERIPTHAKLARDGAIGVIRGEHLLNGGALWMHANRANWSHFALISVRIGSFWG
jgi:hypothetical protein